MGVGVSVLPHRLVPLAGVGLGVMTHIAPGPGGHPVAVLVVLMRHGVGPAQMPNMVQSSIKSMAATLRTG